MSTESKPEYVALSAVKERGWTDTMVRRFLPKPDQTRPNPRYRRAGAPMKLYALDRVERIEATAEFATACEEGAGRRAGAKMAVGTKRARAIKIATTTVIQPLVPLEMDDVIRRARTHYDNRRRDRDDSGSGGYCGNYGPESGDEAEAREEAFVRRITVNYLRHQKTDYDRVLRWVFGRGRGGRYVPHHPGSCTHCHWGRLPVAAGQTHEIPLGKRRGSATDRAIAAPNVLLRPRTVVFQANFMRLPCPWLAEECESQNQVRS